MGGLRAAAYEWGRCMPGLCLCLALSRSFALSAAILTLPYGMEPHRPVTAEDGLPK